MKNKIKNIVWDWNGTIVNDAGLFVDVMNGLLKEKNLPCTTLNFYKKNFCFPIEKYWKSLGFSFTKQEFDFLNNFFISEYKKRMFEPPLHKGITDLFLLMGKKNKQFVLSASEQGLLNSSINFYKLKSFFSDCLGVNNLNARGKIDLGKKLFQKHNLKNKETLFVGDTEHDKEVADSLGSKIVLIAHGHVSFQRLKETKASVVRSVSELEKFFFNL
tara:strand:+ start:9397 stop:10044 length:648 start_codon:yes stop_codon:yes gene_type:complete